MTCFVETCKNNRRLMFPTDGVHISFHKFPKDEELFRLWLEKIGKNNRNIAWRRTLLICSEHFHPNDIIVKRFTHRTMHFLRATAVPKINIVSPNISGLSTPRDDPSTVQQIYIKGEPGISGEIAVSDGDFIMLVGTSQKIPLTAMERGKSNSNTNSERDSIFMDRNISELPKQLEQILPSSGASSSERIDINVNHEHCYAASPTALKQRVFSAEQKVLAQRQTIYNARHQLKCLRRRVSALRQEVKELKNKQKILENRNNTGMFADF